MRLQSPINLHWVALVSMKTNPKHQTLSEMYTPRNKPLEFVVLNVTDVLYIYPTFAKDFCDPILQYFLMYIFYEGAHSL